MEGSTLDLNGYKLIVEGDFYQSGGALTVNDGLLLVDGDYIHSGGKHTLGGGSTYVKESYLIRRPTDTGYIHLMICIGFIS